MISINFTNISETPPGSSQEEIESHIMGVVMIEYFNMKNGINIFGDRAETAVMKKLQNIHDMNTYKSVVLPR